MAVSIKRVYDEAKSSDGYRVLVDRLWPRGVSKDKAKVDLWLKEVGPSDKLRQWFNHDPAKFSEFEKKYRQELTNNPALKQLEDIVKHNEAVTLVYSAKDQDHNQAVVLQRFIS